MTESALADRYRAYIACLNRQDWEICANSSPTTRGTTADCSGLPAIAPCWSAISRRFPDLEFNIEFLVCEAPFVASRLRFDCRPKGLFLGLAVNGRRVVFAENVFYRFESGKVAEVWSVVDKAAIEAQL